MRAVCGLLAVLFILGPIGMGILFNVDAPLMEEASYTSEEEGATPRDHGTRSDIEGSPTDVQLYLHAGSNMMNTTSQWFIPYPAPANDITITLQDPLINDFLVENPQGTGGYGMMAQLELQGQGWLEIEVRDDSSEGILVGTGSHGDMMNPFDYDIITHVDIPIIFEIGTNYTFAKEHYVVIIFDFTGTGNFHHDRPDKQSTLRLHCTPIPDMTVATYNFYNEPDDQFYPNNIGFPVSRRQVIMKGNVHEVFGKHGVVQYVDHVQVVITDPNGDNETKNVDKYDKALFEYTYTWLYAKDILDGKYTVTAHVYDEQDNVFKVSTTFNMSEYGVLLTSPSQEPEEGTFRAEAKRNLVEGKTTTYEINVFNIGKLETDINIEAAGDLSKWDCWLSGANFTPPVNKTGVIEAVPPCLDDDDDRLGIHFTVDSKDNPLGDKATLLVTATTTGDPNEDSTLTTISLVVLLHDVELRFIDGTESQSQEVETGADATYKFRVTNKGGNDDTIYIEVGTTPSGWTKTLTGEDLEGSPAQYWVDILAGDHTELTLTLTTSSTSGEETASIDITGTSKGSIDQGDQTVATDKITTTTSTTIGILLELKELDPSKETDPDEDVSYELELTNTGTSLANITVTYTELSSEDGWDYRDISFDPNSHIDEKKFGNLGPDNPQTFYLFVKPTLSVIADNYSITITAARDDAASTRFDEETVYCIVNEFYKIEIVEPISLELTDEAEPGEDVEYTIIIENSGNVAEKVSIIVDKPSDWDLDFGNASSEWSKEVDPQESETITLVLTVPDDAVGDETVVITVSIIPAVSDTIQVETHTEVKALWYQPFLTLLVPILLFIVIIVMVIVIYKRR
ncbi:MAG: hypothetical protein JSV56_10485 [Methanomassiliicoccales archaeon]|nr:MAG: hypothetical protein JSV56_10485 [Methanomassiliicoccales archaeon]